MNVCLFLYQYHLTNLVKEDTYCKNPRKPRCIDLYLTHNSLSLQDILSVFTGFSDFHKLVRAVFKVNFINS